MKRCNLCKVNKQDDDFFTNKEAQSHAGEAHQESGYKIGEYCKECHSKGLVKHGYGAFGDKFKTPEDTVAR